MGDISNTTQIGSGGVSAFETVQKNPLQGNNFVRGDFSYTASGDTTLADWTVMGQNFTSGEIAPLDPTATDGTQHFFGILKCGVTVLDTETVDNLVVVKNGRFDKNQLVFENSATLDSVIEGRRLEAIMEGSGMEFSDSMDLTV